MRSKRQSSPRVRVTRVCVGAQELAIISFPLGSSVRADQLAPGERAIVSELLLGRTVRQIAARRGTSRRTVEHQLATIYRKLGVRSRNELVARLTR